MKRSSSALCLGVMAALVLLPHFALAQTETGRIVGTVYDTSGAILPGASVTLKAVGTAATRTTVAATNGNFVFANLLPGDYEVKVELSGFNSARIPVKVTVGSAIELSPKLGVGVQTEVITVTADTVSQINTVSQDIATTVTERQIKELPTITRNAYDLVQLSGQVAADNASNRGTGYAINGQRSASTNIQLDGSANNNEFTATVGQQVPLDAVQEFSVITSNFSAQFGRASGGVVNLVTKSGTNEYRGSAYDFFRSDGLSTNSFDNKANEIEKGKFDRHQVGFALGGPLQRDKVHFFVNGEYIRVRSTDTQITWVPTPQFLSASAPATQAFFQRYGKGATINGPILTREQVSAIIGTAAGAFNSLPAGLPVFGQVRKSLANDAGGGDPQDRYELVARLDWNIGPSTQAYVRYALDKQDAEVGTNSSGPYDGYDTPYLNHNHNVLASLTRIFSPNFTSQTKVVWNRLLGDQPLNGEPLPTLYMNPTTAVRLQGQRIGFPGYLPFGPGTAIPFGGPQSFLQLYQDLNWVKGRHDLRFGGSFDRLSDDRTFGAYENSVEALNTSSAALPALNNFVLGRIARFQSAINPGGLPGGSYVTPVQFPSFLSKNRYNEFAVYFNDNWSVAGRLKLNLGVRYEYFGPQTKSDPKFDSNFYYGDPNLNLATSSPQEIVAGVRTGQVLRSNDSPVGGLWKSDKNNFAPRVGFAWDVMGDGKTSLRGSYGIGYERNFGNVTYNVLFNPPEYLVATIDAPSDTPVLPIYTDNAGPFGGIAGIRKTIPAGSLRHVDQNIETAYAHFYSVSFQRELFRNTVGTLEYTGSSGRKLYDLADINKRGAPLVYTGVGTANTRPNTQFAAFNSRGNRGRSQYHGLTVGLESRKLGDTGLQFTARYTLANAKDNLSSTFSDSGNNFNLGYLDAFDPLLDYGNAEFDVKHRLVMSGIWEVPLFRNSTGAAKTLLGGWQFNWIFVARSGYPFTLWDCTNGLGLCMRAVDPGGIGKNANKGTATENPNEFTLLDLAPILGSAGSYVNPITGNSDFGPYPANMTKRDAFRGPGLWNVDLGMSKRFRMGDHYAVQLRLEAYNLFNHANLFAHTGDADISSFPTITGFKDGNRRLQLGAKFEF